MTEIVITGAVRTPFSRYGGTLKKIDSIELGRIVIEELIAQGKYSCCLENPCTLMASPPLSSILEKLKFWGPIAENCKIRKER